MAERINWNALIEDVVAGRWKDSETGAAADLPFQTIELLETTEGREADLIAPLRLGSRIAVVSDVNTFEVMGRRVAKALRTVADIDEIVLPDGLDCEETTVELVREKTRYADGIVAVGSGVLNDSCKHATFLDGRPYAVFGTAASMNGYGASTASVTLASGLKISLPSHAPRGIFLDLGVSAAAPSWLSAAGLGDSLCRSTAQLDWWASHRLFGTYYSDVPYRLQAGDEEPMLAHASGLASHDVTAVGHLQRVLTLCSMGVCFAGVSHPGSMGEHQISHWVDMFAREHHPGTTHGQQVGVASLVMARMQAMLLDMEEPPRAKPTLIDEAAMLGRYGAQLGPLCIAEMRKTALDHRATEAFNRKLEEIWPALRRELRPMAMPVGRMEAALKAAGGPVTGTELGLPRELWHDAIRYSREIRGRWSFVNLAADAGLLEEFLQSEW
ncbi:iron-containing alcohol dehydrogenase [Mesorhizobium sp. dw_380]|uniref:iron-containing alcohol dehydrogenase n=1 Tax=Mesorhizobium sp. dw_380 TaxID=2812001 RepID=UPI003319BE22